MPPATMKGSGITDKTTLAPILKCTARQPAVAILVTEVASEAYWQKKSSSAISSSSSIRRSEGPIDCRCRTSGAGSAKIMANVCLDGGVGAATVLAAAAVARMDGGTPVSCNAR
ncbi:hypothetical protein Ae201684P_014914 [Aphanomyces euteiches]|nr:hypothetical protein Ae201684P_014914 [Aphanomyces euteiches]